MGINEMEFQWRLNWWYRPTQLDGFESSVADYYDCFIDWKANMELNLCPVDEADYVAAFIQNLRCDIRSRLESKGRPSTKRLSDAFYDAKLEESLISIDEAFKKIKAKFEAHKLFDELPSQIEDDESSCAERGSSISEVLSIQIDSEMETHKMPDNLPEQNLCESSSIDQVSRNDDYKSAIMSCNDDIVQSNDDVEETDSEAEASNSVIFLDQIKPDSKGFDALTEPNLEESPSIDQEVLKTKHKDFKFAYKVFDEKPGLFFVEPKGEISGDVGSTPPIDCVPRVFDPGTSRISGDLGASHMLNMHLSSLCMNNELTQPAFIATAGYEAIEKGLDAEILQNFQLKLALKFNKSTEPTFTGLNLFSGKFYTISTLEEVEIPSLKAGVTSSYISTHSNVELFAGNVLFLFDPGGRSSKLSILQSVTRIGDNGSN